MRTIKQKWKIISSERGLALPETGRKVRLNPICQKTEGSGEGGAEGGKLELPLGRGRGAGDPPPKTLPEHRRPRFSSLPAATHSQAPGMSRSVLPEAAPWVSHGYDVSRLWAPPSQGPGPLPAGTGPQALITVSLVPLGVNGWT